MFNLNNKHVKLLCQMLQLLVQVQGIPNTYLKQYVILMFLWVIKLVLNTDLAVSILPESILTELPQLLNKDYSYLDCQMDKIPVLDCLHVNVTFASNCIPA